MKVANFLSGLDILKVHICKRDGSCGGEKLVSFFGESSWMHSGWGGFFG